MRLGGLEPEPLRPGAVFGQRESLELHVAFSQVFRYHRSFPFFVVAKEITMGRRSLLFRSMKRTILLSTLLVGMLMGHANASPLTALQPMDKDDFRERYPVSNGTSGYLDLVVDGMPMKAFHNVAGEGPDLVLLHGICDSLHTWDGWVEELQDEFRIIRLDYPPFGLTSTFPDGVYTEERMFDFLDAFLLASGVKMPCYVAGNSLGGGIAWRYATARSGRVQKLILIDPAGFVDEKDDLPKAIRWAENRFAASFMRRKMPHSTWKRTVRDLYGESFRSVPKATFDFQVNRFHDLSRLPGKSANYVEFFRYILDLAEADSDERIAERISQLTIPVQLMWGEEYSWFPPHEGPMGESNLEKWKASLSSPPQIILYPGVGHMPQLQIAKQSASDARGFLSEASP